MVTLNTDAIVSEPLKTQRLGNTVRIDVGTDECLLVVSREKRMPRASIIVTTAASNLIRMSKDGQKLDSIVIVSSGADPTQHPDFKEISENVRDLRNKWYPKAELCVLSHCADLESPSVRAAMGVYDRPIMSLEWGSTKTFAALTKRKSTVLTPMVRHLRTLERVVVQARFVRGKTDNSTDSEVQGWIRRLKEVRPREVQILAGDTRSRKKTVQRPVPKSRLEQIAAMVTEKTGIPAIIFQDEPSLG